MDPVIVERDVFCDQDYGATGRAPVDPTDDPFAALVRLDLLGMLRALHRFESLGFRNTDCFRVTSGFDIETVLGTQPEADLNAIGWHYALSLGATYKDGTRRRTGTRSYSLPDTVAIL